MKPYNALLSKAAFLYFLVGFITASARAQKLPEVQKVSVRAPENAVADGKATEWGGKFQAHNMAAGVWYSVANDDDKLYFIIHGEDADLIHKMMRGCVTITINPLGKKNDKGAISVTFPSYKPDEAPNVSLSGRPKTIPDTVKFKLKTDSFMRAMNKKLIEKQKFIALNGLKEVTDTLISVYNDYDIDARAILDSKLNYNYELTLPLKYLGLSVTNPTKFSYNISLNGIVPKGSVIATTSSNNLLYATDANGKQYIYPNNTRNVLMVYPNDFWGEYVLAKK